VHLRLTAREIPLLPGALECVPAGICTGLRNNREFVECVVEFASHIDESWRALLFDPQTSGGLLISLPEGEAGELVRRLREAGLPAVQIGSVLPPSTDARASRLISVE
jgi:selenide,water dikinase